MVKQTIYDMGNLVKKNDTTLAINIQKVEDKIAVIRNLEVIADADVAELYGVQTKEVNQAVRNNSAKFPSRYMFELTSSELRDLRSKILTTNVSAKNRNPTKVFTERGLYMLATILKGERAEKTTLAIIDTFVQVRELARTMEAVEDGGAQQRTLLQRTGDLLAEVVGHNLSTRTTETEIELNFAVVKIKHKVIRKDETGKE